MSNASERPAGTSNPLQYAPRWARDPNQPREPAASATSSAAARAEAEGGDPQYERPYPLGELRSPRVHAVPPPPDEPRRPMTMMRETALLALVALVSALVVAYVMYPRKSDTDAGNAAAPPVLASTQARPVMAAATPAPVAIEEPASPAATTTMAAVTPTQRGPMPAVRGVTDSEIRLGIAAPFSGSARELGRQMKLGLDAAFGAVNAAGGIHGRQIKLIAADDGYEPGRTGNVMKQLTEKEQVFGIVGNVGTPTAVIALPYALEQKMLFFGAFTGAGLLRRDPPDRYVFNYRASYAEETDATVRYLVKVRRIRPEQIAVFAQQDSYGDAGFAGVAKAIRALKGTDAGNILRLGYQRNTVDVTAAVEQLRLSKVPIKAVVMVPTYRAAAKFIEKTKDLFPGLIYTNVSFVGSSALAEELRLLGPRYAEGVIVTQVVPAIEGYSSFVLEYKSALAKYSAGEAPDYVSLEGYITGRLLAEGLLRAGPQLDTEKLVDTLENLRDFDMGLGTPLSFGRGEHQSSHKVWGTALDEAGRYQAIEMQ